MGTTEHVGTTEPIGTALDARHSGIRRVARWHPLTPVAHRGRWIGSGLAVQALAVAGLGAWAYGKYKKDAALGMAAKATVKLVWQEAVHSGQGIAVLVAAALVFAFGSVLAARPYARTVEMLVVVVPLAAIAGVVVLGVIALLLAVIIAIAWASDGGGGGSWGGSGGGKRKPSAVEQLVDGQPPAG